MNINISLIGNEKVGKTSIFNIICQKEFNTTQISTIGADIQSIPFSIYGQEIKLTLFDTSGKEEYKSIIPMAFHIAQAIIIVFDVTNEDSFFDVESWIIFTQDYIDKPFIVLVGNKTDLIDQRKVSENEAEKFAIDNNLHYFETSALNKDGIKDLFQYCVTKSYNSKLILK